METSTSRAASALVLLAVLLLASVAYNVHQHLELETADRRRMLGDQAEMPRHAQPHSRRVLGGIPAYDLYSVSLGNRRHTAGFLVPVKTREDLGQMLESMGGFKVGVELGVQRGYFAQDMLTSWISCEKYYLVDLWAEQPNYIDFANVDDAKQLSNMKEAEVQLKPWESKTVFIKNYTTAAAPLIPDNVDFIYVDARHDYCGVMEDLNTYWPKLRPGGILAGHDYVSAHDVYKNDDKQQWSLCLNGTINHGAVRGAVDDFALKHGLFVAVTYDEPHMWKTFIIRKHHACEHSHSG